MLVAAPEQRGTGIGRALVAFAEQRSRERGLRAMQLELLVPRDWRHPSKEFLKAWYGRIGYRIVRTGSIDDAHPHLAPLLATPCDLQVYEKPLHVARRRRGEPGQAVSRASQAIARARTLASESSATPWPVVSATSIAMPLPCASARRSRALWASR